MKGQDFHIERLPDDPKQAIQLLNQQIEKLNFIITKLLSGRYDPLPSAPLKPRAGLVAYADGTNWDPGAGEGLYEYRSDSLWHKL